MFSNNWNVLGHPEDILGFFLLIKQGTKNYIVCGQEMREPPWSQQNDEGESSGEMLWRCL